MANYTDITPVMTANMGAGGYRSSASTTNGDLGAWRAFDSQTTTATSECIWHSGGGMPQWIKLEFPEAVQVDLFSIQNRPDTGNAAAKGITAFQLQGSNDGDTFDTLGTYTSDGAIGATYEYTVTTPGKYKCYRVYITAAGYVFGTTQYALIEQIRFYSLAGETIGGKVNIGGTVRKLIEGYVNIGGVAHKLLEGYANIDGVLHLIYKGVPTPEEPTSRLPSGYKEVEYIESTGTQYIDTGVSASSSIRFEIDFLTNSEFISSSGFGTIFGCINSGSNRYSLGTYPDSVGGHFCYGSNNYNPEMTKGKRIQLSLIGNSFKTPSQNWTVSGTFTVGATITIFARKWVNGNIDEYSKTKLYSFKLYDSTTLIRDFVPCKNPSGAVGLFDLVNSTFYANKGSGSFTAGAEV